MRRLCLFPPKFLCFVKCAEHLQSHPDLQLLGDTFHTQPCPRAALLCVRGAVLCPAPPSWGSEGSWSPRARGSAHPGAGPHPRGALQALCCALCSVPGSFPVSILVRAAQLSFLPAPRCIPHSPALPSARPAPASHGQQGWEPPGQPWVRAHCWTGGSAGWAALAGVLLCSVLCCSHPCVPGP